MKIPKTLVCVCTIFSLCQADAATWPREWWEKLRGAFSGSQPAVEPISASADPAAMAYYEARVPPPSRDPDDIEYRQTGQLIERRLRSVEGVYIEFDPTTVSSAVERWRSEPKRTKTERNISSSINGIAAK